MSKFGRSILCLIGIHGAMATAVAANLAQTLDSVDAYAPGAALKMRFDDSRRDRYATGSEAFAVGVQPAAGRSLLSCVRAPNRDLVCLEGALVRSWSDAEEAVPAREAPRDLFSCTDDRLGLITRGNPCTAVAVDPSGAIWLAGRNRKSSFSLLKVVPVPNTSDADTCPAPYGQFLKLRSSLGNLAQGSAVSDYCVAEYATGRPALEDISYVGGDVGAAFVGPDGVRGPGVLLMEQRLTVSFVPDPEPRTAPGTTPFTFPVEPKVIGDSRSTWGFNRGEELQSAAVLQRDGTNGARLSYAVVATNQGRLLAKKADGLSDAFMVYDVVANRRSTQCSPTAQPRFAVRTRYESNRGYVSDAACGEVQALEPGVAPNAPSCSPLGGEFFFCNAREFDVSGPQSAPVVSTTTKVDVTLATTSTETGLLEPVGLTVSPGIGIDLNGCARTGTCPVVPDGNGNGIGALLTRVTLVDTTKSGVTMYQVVGIPDCRQEPHRTLAATPTPTQLLCQAANAVVTIDNREFLDVSKLLPAEIRKLFDANTPLPQLLISPIYRARPENGNLFEAFFARTEEGVTFRQTLDFQIDAPELTGKPQFDCGGATPGRPDLSFNVITTISERYVTASKLAKSGSLQTDPVPLEAGKYVDMLVTTACSNPQSSAGTVRLSVFPYNLAVAPEQFPRNRYAPPLPVPLPSNFDRYNDVYANLLVSLFDDLGIALDATARVDVDSNANGTAPLSATAWQSLKSSWLNAQDKLGKCVGAAYDKSSAADQTCQAFFVQMSSFRSAAAATLPQGTDRANRVGELVGRSDVIVYVLGAHFLPSIPVNGFYRPDPL